jgi:hypothetical protein
LMVSDMMMIIKEVQSSDTTTACYKFEVG